MRGATLTKPFTVTEAQREEFANLLRVGPVEICWEWEGEVNEAGYPKLSKENGHKLAHRIAFAEVNPGLVYRMSTRQIHHTCYNKLCVNAGHMQLVTQKEHQGITTQDHFDKIDRMRLERGFDI